MAEFGPPPLITRDDLLAALARNMEAHWIEGLLADPTSLSMFEGSVAALLRIQTAIDQNLSIGAFILTAPGRAPATSILRITRPSGALGEIPTTIRILDDRGAEWRPSAVVAVPASGGVQTLDIPITTVRTGYWLNSYEPLTYTLLDPLFDPLFVVLASPLPATGGTTAVLDQHGKERRVFRAPLEVDDLYRNRIRFLEDQVSPKALTDTITQVLDGYPLYRDVVDLIVRYGMVAFREPFRDTAQPSYTGMGGLDVPFADDPELFADDPHGKTLRAPADGLAFFDVLLPTVVDPGEPRPFYDDDNPDHGPFADDLLLAYPDQLLNSVLVVPITALADELDRRRMGGVRFRIIQGGIQTLARHPKLGTLTDPGSWVNEDGVATDPEMVASLASFDADASYAMSVLGTGALAPLSASDLRFTLEAIPVPLAISHLAIRCRARMASVGAGVNPSLGFLLKPTTAGAAIRLIAPDVGGYPKVVDHTDYREFALILEQNPETLAAWTLADVAGPIEFGVANMAAAGATNQLRVSELWVEIFANYG